MTQEQTLSPITERVVSEEDRAVQIEVVPHVIYVLCGPTMCGKSTFARALASTYRNYGYSARILSSDNFRASLLGVSSFMGNIGKEERHADAALSTSKQAFRLLEAELNAITSFPVVTDCVIVDTTGFSDEFRDMILAVAAKKQYKTALVLFDYKSRQDYLMGDMTPSQVEVVNNSRDRYRKKILPNLGASKFDAKIRVKTRYSNLVVINEDDIEGWSFTRRSGAQLHAVIGDSHECVSELKLLVAQLEAEFPGIQIVHVGDWLDKGKNTEEAVNFMWERYKSGDVIVDGNHENYVVKRLREEIEAASVEKEQFTSLEVLANSADLAEKVFEIWGNSVPFLVLTQGDSGQLPVYITHAPCQEKYLGKTDFVSLRAQRNYRTIDRSASVYDEFKWLFQEADRNLPLHIFGHLSHEVSGSDFRELRNGNRVFLDTGAVYGGHLSAVLVQDGRLTGMRAVKSEARTEAVLPKKLGFGPNRDHIPFDIDEYDLSVHELRLINQIKANGVKYISGTMSPGPSTDTEIEGLDPAFDFLQGRGVEEVIMEPKWMGSRAQLYLFEGAPEMTFMVSRGGWKIRKIEGLDEAGVQTFMLAQFEKYRHLVEVHGNLILDGELMPWSALGEGLINDHFTAYEGLVVDELAALKGDTSLDGLPGFKAGLNLPSKVSHAIAFSKVLSQFSQRAEPSFMAFGILQAGSGQLFTEDTAYQTVSEEVCLTVKLSSDTERQVAREFFKALTVGEKMEGVVLKPITPRGHPIPAVKVRSEEYLRLVYGYDWMDRKDKLCKQKNVSRKIQVSISEAELAAKMLASQTEEECVEYAVKMIGQMKVEKTLDPRL